MPKDVLGPLLEEMLRLTRARLTNKVGRVVVMPGSSVVEDDCCSGGGQLHVRIISIVGVSGLSVPATQPCNPLYQVRCGLGVTRCAHVVDDNGVPPSAAEMSSDAFKTFQDRTDMVQALACDIHPLVEKQPGSGGLRIEDWLPTVVGGGCVGGELSFTFKHSLCSDCSEEKT